MAANFFVAADIYWHPAGWPTFQFLRAAAEAFWVFSVIFLEILNNFAIFHKGKCNFCNFKVYAMFIAWKIWLKSNNKVSM